MTDWKLPWASTPAAHSFDTFPALEEYDRLIKEYADAAQTPFG